jgi:1-deoxy-D-xylulose-5-phosphate synthase
VGEFLLDEGLQVPLLRFGLPDRFVGQGTRDELWEALGLLPEQIAERVKDRLQHLTGEE